MIVMEYGSLIFAERNSGEKYALPISPLSDKDWDTAIRGVNKYEECAFRYLGEKVNRGLWLGDEYLAYGAQGLLENGNWYGGVRKWKQIPSGWMKASLSDRGDETLDTQGSSFDVVWKDNMRSCVVDSFWRTPHWRSELRHIVFRGEIPDSVNTFQVSMYGDIVEGNPEKDGFHWSDIIRDSKKIWGKDYISSGSGFIFYHRNDPLQWYLTDTELDTDLAWGLGLDIEDYVELLFQTAIS
ncbi:hypothetical protein [Corynebacterium oculi]|uniref:Uncharacterized protein n=1 Tax=Corynebacterium oculi TaxID=1544416 RepID=A0A0N8VZZ1_9CORY|nr:hypothetical protein [Corynebacterium oculi]KQB85242.1 hypothetical protein Cocul_00380 [Corynebacterium oculi]